MFLKVDKPNNFELRKSLTVTLTNIWGLPSNVVNFSLNFSSNFIFLRHIWMTQLAQAVSL